VASLTSPPATSLAMDRNCSEFAHCRRGCRSQSECAHRSPVALVCAGHLWSFIKLVKGFVAKIERFITICAGRHPARVGASRHHPGATATAIHTAEVIMNLGFWVSARLSLEFARTLRNYQPPPSPQPDTRRSRRLLSAGKILLSITPHKSAAACVRP
jgi:hypothetical protein